MFFEEFRKKLLEDITTLNGYQVDWSGCGSVDVNTGEEEDSFLRDSRTTDVQHTHSRGHALIFAMRHPDAKSTIKYGRKLGKPNSKKLNNKATKKVKSEK